MQYTAIDGKTLESKTNTQVIYTCDIPRSILYTIGSYDSVETKLNDDNILQQIKINRTFNENKTLTIKITESTIEEINQYIIDCKSTNNL